MNRLATVVVFTPQIERMKSFYGDQLGLPIRIDNNDWVEFDTGGATLALHRMADPERRGVEFRLQVDDVEERMRELGERGVRFQGVAQRVPGGTVAGLWDPEGTMVGLVSFENGRVEGRGPRLATAIVNCRDLAGTKAFYRNVMGLHPTNDTAWWVEFDTGETHLSLHPRMAAPDRDHHHGRPLTWSVEIEDLIGWCDACRNRGVQFPTGPHDTPYGQMADVEDPDGNLFIVHEPAPPQDELEEVIDDESPHAAPIRKPGTVKARAISRLAVKPDYREPRSDARRRPSAITQAVAKVRGAGPDRQRLEPKTKADEKKAKVKPAIGRSKKAVQTRKDVQKRETANVSRGKVPKTKGGKPVRKPASRRGNR